MSLSWELIKGRRVKEENGERVIVCNRMMWCVRRVCSECRECELSKGLEWKVRVRVVGNRDVWELVCKKKGIVIRDSVVERMLSRVKSSDWLGLGV